MNRLLAVCAGLLLAGLAPAPFAFADSLGDMLGPLRPSVMPDLPRVVAVAAMLDPAWYVAPLNGRNGFLLLHLIGLSLGFGATLVLDTLLLTWMASGRSMAGFAVIFSTLMRAVSAGLALLWLSGLGFLVLYAAFDPAKLANPKLYAKIGVVLALTVNGIVLHRHVLPLVLADVERPLLDGVRFGPRLVAIACGAVSAVSWTFAVLLGTLRELNGRAGISQILPLWLACILTLLTVSFAALDHSHRRARRIAEARSLGASPLRERVV